MKDKTFKESSERVGVSYQVGSRLDPNGHEIPDPTPLVTPVELGRRQESMDERIRRILEFSLVKQAQEAGMESMEDADDFDVEDDLIPQDPTTPWEADQDAHLVSGVRSGVVQEPRLTPERHAELIQKYGKKKKGDKVSVKEEPPPEPTKEPGKA